MRSMGLVEFLAQACHYAQAHIDDNEAWSTQEADREHLLQCTSFQVACFLAHNTVYGDGGVDWSVVIEELVQYPMKSIESWKSILDDKVKEYGGLLMHGTEVRDGTET